MRIGILTLPPHTNFGGILQAYAMTTILKRMGHEAYVIDRDPYWELPLKKKILCYPKRVMQRYLLGKKNVHIFIEENEKRVRPIIRQYTDCFVNKYLRMYPVELYDELGKSCFFDGYVVGSDQIWRRSYMPHIEDAFIAFDKREDIKIMAYATSFGIDKWDYTTEQTKNCKELVKRFCSVSVREDSAVQLCKNYLNAEAKWVLDPTMLLNVEDYIKLVENSGVKKSKGTLMVYILDQSQTITAAINKFADTNGLLPFVINGRVDDYYAPLEQRIQPPVESWLRGFMDSKVIITDSFHACVFSILFHKKFYVIGNKERGQARFNSLLGLFDLADNMVNSVDGINVDKLLDVDWNKVDSILEAKRDEALNMFKGVFE